MVAAPPCDRLPDLRSTSGMAHLVATEALRSRPGLASREPLRRVLVLYAVVIPVSHLTSWYNLTLEHESVHNAEHLAFLVVGYLFWRQIFGSDPNEHRLHPALQFFYLFMAIPIDTFTGLSLAGASHGCSRPISPPPDLGPVLCDRPPCRRRHHVGRRRHADAVADDPRCPALDAHGRAQGGPDRPRCRRGGAARGRCRGPCPPSSPGPSAPRGPRRDRRAARQLEGCPAEVDAGPARLDDRPPSSTMRAARAATSLYRKEGVSARAEFTACRSRGPSDGCSIPKANNSIAVGRAG